MSKASIASLNDCVIAGISSIRMAPLPAVTPATPSFVRNCTLFPFALYRLMESLGCRSRR